MVSGSHTRLARSVDDWNMWNSHRRKQRSWKIARIIINSMKNFHEMNFILYFFTKIFCESFSEKLTNSLVDSSVNKLCAYRQSRRFRIKATPFVYESLPFLWSRHVQRRLRAPAINIEGTLHSYCHWLPVYLTRHDSGMMRDTDKRRILDGVSIRV